MTNKQLLKADLLDIIFENRNKDYGAYSLRRNYSKHMLLALLSGLVIVAVFIIVNNNSNTENKTIAATTPDNKVVIREYVIPTKPKEPEVKKQPAPVKKVTKPAVPKTNTSTVKNNTIKVVPDKLADKEIPSTDDLKDKDLADVNNEKGKPGTGTLVVTEPPVTKEPEGPGASGPSQPDFTKIEMDPEFPGGPAALSRFLSSNLSTPEELDAGEKKTVMVRFQVGKDGSVSTFEILSSGGKEFDQEVLRVMKRMPKWKPAFQNGVNVPVSFMLPVTFIGAEQ